jgi:hypothetical protein
LKVYLEVLLLVFCVACSPVTGHAVVPVRANQVVEDGEVSLSLRVVKDTAARGLEYPKALEITLRNGLARRDIWVEGKMALPPGTLELELRTGSGTRLPETCMRNQALSKTWDYVLLSGGSAITRVVRLSDCYRLPNDEPLFARARYHNQAIHVPSSPYAWVPLFRGPLTSNTVNFVMRDN